MSERRRRYTKREKVLAVMAADASTVTAAAEAKGIPESTVRYWVQSEAFAELRAKGQEERAEGYRVTSLLAQARLIELIPSMEPRDLITLMGVAADKGQLLAGGATSRTESRDLTDVLDDHEKTALRDAINAELSGRREPVG